LWASLGIGLGHFDCVSVCVCVLRGSFKINYMFLKQRWST